MQPIPPSRCCSGGGWRVGRREEKNVFDWIVGMVEQTGYLGVALLMFAENLFPRFRRS